MPFGTLEAAFKEALATAPSDVAVLDTIEISHPDSPEVYYLAANTEDLDLTLETAAVETFSAAAFRLSLPETSDGAIQNMTLSLDNTDRRIIDFINIVKESTTPVECRYRPYLSNDLTQPQMDPPLLLHITDITIGLLEIVATATFLNLTNMKFPSELYTRARFPSIGQ